MDVDVSVKAFENGLARLAHGAHEGPIRHDQDILAGDAARVLRKDLSNL